MQLDCQADFAFKPYSKQFVRRYSRGGCAWHQTACPEDCNTMVQAWWAAGLAVPAVLLKGMITNSKKKQTDNQNERF